MRQQNCTGMYGAASRLHERLFLPDISTMKKRLRKKLRRGEFAAQVEHGRGNAVADPGLPGPKEWLATAPREGAAGTSRDVPSASELMALYDITPLPEDEARANIERVARLLGGTR